MTTSTTGRFAGGGRRHVAAEPGSVNAQAVDGSTLIVLPSNRPLNRQLGEMASGNKPTDGGWLILYAEEYDEVMADPIAARYVRKYVGARELLHDGDRYCLWLTKATAGDLLESPVLRTRVDAVREFRAHSKAASTREAASTPHLFRQITQPSTSYLCIPAHISEARPYFLAARFSPDVVTSNSNFLAADADGFMFAIISTTMFMTWQRSVGARVRSDLRFNKLLTWNTFPLPRIDIEARRRIIAAGEGVLAARQLQPDLPLSDLYAQTTMSNELIDGHQALDREVDQLFGLTSQHPTERERQDVLFARYQKMIAPSVAVMTCGHRRDERTQLHEDCPHRRPRALRGPTPGPDVHRDHPSGRVPLECSLMGRRDVSSDTPWGIVSSSTDAPEECPCVVPRVAHAAEGPSGPAAGCTPSP